MLKLGLFFASLCFVLFAMPLDTEMDISKLISFTPAVDFSVQVPVNQLQCLRQNGYNLLLLRGFSAEGDGEFDPNAIINGHNAMRYSFGLQIYMEPQPASKTKNATQQLDEMIGALYHYGLHFRNFWLQVSSKSLSTWNSDAASNIAFLDAIISQAHHGGIGVGVFTSQDDWKTITNNWIPNYPSLPLWYSNVKGNGVQGETPQDFNDFVPFGPFTTPTAKQYGIGESDCQVANNRDIYVNSQAAPQSLFQAGAPKTLEEAYRNNFYTPAVDFSAHVPVNQLSCLKLSGYFILFLRGFSAENDGEFDPNAIINFHNALKCRQPPKPRTPPNSLDEMMGSLTHYGLYFRFFWLQVSSKTLSKWNSDAVFNVAFIDAIISRAQQGGIGVGIYTNQDEWKQITNNWTPNYPNIPLWYSSVKGNDCQVANNRDIYIKNEAAPFSFLHMGTPKAL
ncbi:unnamed protein product [Caenorhabditis auriculariae]|uniref:Uncharacterized protein n=1 Tax=Caenorhabditis auriculariae TaxID=2777116 RepID=A0A8S1H9T3_9PELO|nr:unnamed protein product [Caenorhabditis auriculariae]